MDIRSQCLCVDSPEPKKIASFWEQPRAGAGPSTKDDQVCLEPPKGGPRGRRGA